MEITIQLCCGTFCHIMGGAELQAALDSFTPNFGNNVKLSYATCLNKCKDEIGKPPFAMVNDIVIPEASPEKIIETIEKIQGED